MEEGVRNESTAAVPAVAAGESVAERINLQGGNTAVATSAADGCDYWGDQE